MHCKTSAICSASGHSESQIRPTLTAINKTVDQSNNEFINPIINPSVS